MHDLFTPRPLPCSPDGAPRMHAPAWHPVSMIGYNALIAFNSHQSLQGSQDLLTLLETSDYIGGHEHEAQVVLSGAGVHLHG